MGRGDMLWYGGENVPFVVFWTLDAGSFYYTFIEIPWEIKLSQRDTLEDFIVYGHLWVQELVVGAFWAFRAQ